MALPCAYSFPPNSRFLFLPLSEKGVCDQRGGMRVELGRKYHLHWHHSFGWNAKSLQSIHITFMLFMSYLVSRVLLSVVYRFSNIDITKYHIDTSFQFLFPSFMALHWQLTRTYEDVTCVRKRNDYSLKKKSLTIRLNLSKQSSSLQQNLHCIQWNVDSTGNMATFSINSAVFPDESWKVCF